jgi:hypothetical protein
MPITVAHGPDADYAAIIDFLAAEEQVRRQRAQQRAAQALAQQQMLMEAARSAGQAPAQAPSQAAPQALPAQAAGAPPEQVIQGLSPADQLRRELGLAQIAQRDREAGLDAQSRRAAAFYGSGRGYQSGRSDQAIASIINNLISGQQDSGDLAARLQAQQQGMQFEAGHDFALSAHEGGIDLINELLSQEPPANIAEGLASGAYAHTREQDREMEEILDSIAKADRAPNLTPQEKIAFQREQAIRFSRINNSPRPVPRNKQPVTPQQQFQQGTVTHTDPTTGKATSYFMGRRNGEPNPIPLGEKDDQGKFQLDQQKFEHQQEQHVRDMEDRDQDQSMREREVQIKEREVANSLRKQLLTAQMQMELEALQMQAPEEKMFPGAPDPKTGKPTTNTAKFGAEQSAYSAKQKAFSEKWLATIEGMGGGAMQEAQGLGQPPQQRTTDQSQGNFEIIGPNPAGRYAKKHPDGRVELLPEGFAP